jgi:zinc D-Ala-D-Ala dipeptidase
MRRTLAAAIVLLAAPSAHAGDRPRGFVDAKTFIPDLIVEMRYTMAHNFVGKPIPGYKAPRCLLTRPAAQALQCAADGLRQRGYTLKVYDCYRPQTAVNAFVSWGRDLRDQKTKPEFYPEVDKRRLFVEGYIASRSGHSRGSTVDVTLVKLPAKPQPRWDGTFRSCIAPYRRRFRDTSVNMGTSYDCMDPRAATFHPAIKGNRLRNRLLLKRTLERVGFAYYSKEWWHFTLRDEPYPEKYFNFPVARRSVE